MHKTAGAGMRLSRPLDWSRALVSDSGPGKQYAEAVLWRSRDRIRRESARSPKKLQRNRGLDQDSSVLPASILGDSGKAIRGDTIGEPLGKLSGRLTPFTESPMFVKGRRGMNALSMAEFYGELDKLLGHSLLRHPL